MIEPSQNLQRIFDNAVQVAKQLQHEYITIEHLVYSIICDEESFKIVENYGADANFIKSNLDHYIKNNLKEIVVTETEYKPKKTSSVSVC